MENLGQANLSDKTQSGRPVTASDQLSYVCQDIADSLDKGVRIDAIIVDFSKAFILVPHDRLLAKIVATGVDLRVVVWIKEFILGRSQRVRVDGQ
jgi:hypothetical protein